MKAQLNTTTQQEYALSEMQMEILQMLAYEYNSSEMELEMKLPWKSIRHHLWLMYRELGVSSRAGLIRVAFEKRLLVLA